MKKNTPEIIELLNEYMKNTSIEDIKKIYSCIDLTNLNSIATKKDITELCSKALRTNYGNIQISNVASVCIYPVYVKLCKEILQDININIVVAAGCFPHAQSYPEVKYLETEMAINNGATEIDVVINLSSFINREESITFDEIKTIKQICGTHKLKVILETDLINQETLIKEAAVMCLEAGADFLKTSTGKDGSVASPEAVFVLCNVIKEYAKKTGFKAGIKPAGGISAVADAIEYYYLVEGILGKEWLNSSLFRIGASSLADNILNDLSSYS